MLVAVTLLLAGCGSDDETTPAKTSTTATAAPTTAEAPATTTTSLVDAEAPAISVVFDGETCAYEGPAQTSPAEILNVELVNTSDAKSYLYVMEYTEDDTAALAAAIGQNFEQGAFGNDPPLRVAAELWAEPGATSSQDILLGPATWLVSCQTPDPTWLWPGGVIEST
jgi:hypothetical protein